MVQQRRWMILGVVLLIGILISHPGLGQTPNKTEPIDRKPYVIRVAVGFDPETRVDAARRARIIEEWLSLTRRLIGQPWSIEVVEGAERFATLPIDEWKADTLKGFVGPGKPDKVWAIQARALGAGYRIEGRELDLATGWLGEVHRREVDHPIDASRTLLELSRAIFAPLADVGESKGGGVSFLVQGGSLPVASSLGEVAPVGTVFRALRLFQTAEGATQEIREVPYSYFRVERSEGAIARCEIIRGVGDPLTNRYARKNKLVALGIKPASSPTRLRFLMKGDRQPAAGYRLIARQIPPGVRPIEAGTTDRDGRIVLPPGFARGLVSLRLIAGNEEPMLDVPVIPGETLEERTLIFEPRPYTLTLEARLEALRDAIVDVVAVRSRLELRMKARLDGEDWKGLDESINEFRKLTPREQFQTQLDQIRTGGEQQQTELKTTVLTRNALAQLDETKNLIERYLDDDAIRGYEDAALRARAERTAPKPAAKGAAPAKKSATRPK